jgi:ADP-ribose pyrophosphatase YjhB (NUDIX family)
VLKRILYWVLGRLASISFNILNLCLAGNLPPLGCICVIVEDQGRYLLLRRPGGDLVFPAGFIRWREPPTQTAQREFKEETGLEIDLQYVVGCYSYVSTRFDRMSTLTLSYCGKVTGGEMRGSIEGRPCWIDESELHRMLDVRYIRMLDDYRKHRREHVELSPGQAKS